MPMKLDRKCDMLNFYLDVRDWDDFLKQFIDNFE